MQEQSLLTPIRLDLNLNTISIVYMMVNTLELMKEK